MTMNLRKLALLLSATAAAVLFTGCTSTHTTADGNTHTLVLGGLYESQQGAYQKQPKSTLPINGDNPAPGSKLSGTYHSFLWGLVTYRDQ